MSEKCKSRHGKGVKELNSQVYTNTSMKLFLTSPATVHQTVFEDRHFISIANYFDIQLQFPDCTRHFQGQTLTLLGPLYMYLEMPCARTFILLLPPNPLLLLLQSTTSQTQSHFSLFSTILSSSLLSTSSLPHFANTSLQPSACQPQASTNTFRLHFPMYPSHPPLGNPVIPPPTHIRSTPTQSSSPA